MCKLHSQGAGDRGSQTASVSLGGPRSFPYTVQPVVNYRKELTVSYSCSSLQNNQYIGDWTQDEMFPKNRGLAGTEPHSLMQYSQQSLHELTSNEDEPLVHRGGGEHDEVSKWSLSACCARHWSENKDVMVQLFPLSTSTLVLKQRTRPYLREPLLPEKAQCSQPKAETSVRSPNLGLGLTWDRKTRGEGSPGREHSRSWPSRSPVQPAGSLCSWPAVNSWEPSCTGEKFLSLLGWLGWKGAL